MEENIHVCCMAIHSFGTQTQAHGTEPKPKAAANPGPKGQHRQEFRMVYHKKKGFKPDEQ